MSSFLETGAYWIVSVYGIISAHVVKSYHESKPLGLQTFLSKVIVLLTNTFMAFTAYGALLLTCINVGVGPIYSLILVMIAQYFFLNLHMSCLFVLVTKYLSIYHSQWVFALNDERAMGLLKSTVWTLPLILTVLEYTALTRIQDTPMFWMLMGTDHDEVVSQKHEVTRSIMSVALVLGTAGLQLRLEYDNFIHGENPNCCLHLIFRLFQQQHPNNQNESDPLEYKMSILRFAACFTTLLVGTVNLLFWTYDGFIDTNKLIVFGFVFVNILMPSLFIYNHQGLRKHFINKLYHMLRCLSFVPSSG